MKKMLKAISGIAIACMLIGVLCMTVFAAGSPLPDGITCRDNDTFYAIPGAASQTLTEAEALRAIDKTDGTVRLINYDMGTTNGLGATVEFYVPGTEGSWLYILHHTAGNWEVEANAPGPYVEAEFDKFSPVYVVVYTPGKNPAPAPTPAPGGKTTPAQSPKTGEVDYILFAALAAVLVGGVVAGVAVRKNKA